MENIIIIVVVAVIVSLAGIYVYKAKKSGKKCVGCPDGCSCSTKNNGCSECCGCSDNEKDDK